MLRIALLCAVMGLTSAPVRAERIVNAFADFAGLDKITGRIITFSVSIDEMVQFGTLRLKARACYTRPITEAPQTDSFVEVDEVKLNNQIERIFSGWMFAASPGLHGIEHPIYDIWLTGCHDNVAPIRDLPATPAKPAAPAKPATPPKPANPSKPAAPAKPAAKQASAKLTVE
jgi:hypothetical protein